MTILLFKVCSSSSILFSSLDVCGFGLVVWAGGHCAKSAIELWLGLAEFDGVFRLKGWEMGGGR